MLVPVNCVLMRTYAFENHRLSVIGDQTEDGITSQSEHPQIGHGSQHLDDKDIVDSIVRQIQH